MADNINYNPQGSTPIASDDVGGVQYQRIKISVGADGAATDQPVSSNNYPIRNISEFKGAGNFTTGQVDITNSATLVASSRATRRAIIIVNHGTTVVFLGASDVVTTTGIKLLGLDGASISLDITGAIYGITTGSTQTISFVEVYD